MDVKSRHCEALFAEAIHKMPEYQRFWIASRHAALAVAMTKSGL